MQKNIMSVDLEDYFCDLPFSTWENYESRISNTTRILLDLFEKYDVTATFFTLGYIAEKHPELIEEIKSHGHEISSHGYSHTDIRKMTKEQFESDLLKSISVIQKISGEKVLGFRAPFFSIDKSTLWTFDILKKHMAYDSSIFPVRTPLYGIPSAKRYPYVISDINPLEENSDGTFIEIPPSTLQLPLFGNIPIAGGFHLRFLPTQIIKYGIKKLNRSNRPGVFYIHPKDLDPQMPKISEYAWHYYWNLKQTAKKFESILKDFKFSCVRDVILE